MTEPIGPYCTFDLREWWVPIAAASYLDARREVKACAVLEWDQVLVYHGRAKDVWVDPGCDGHEDDDEWEACETAYRADCWHFVVELR